MHLNFKKSAIKNKLLGITKEIEEFEFQANL